MIEILNYISKNIGFGVLKNLVPAKAYCSYIYQRSTGKKINWKNPTTFNEKLQWLKVYDHNPLYTQMVDKYSVRSYISEKIGEEYLIPLIGVWDKFEDINFDELPDQFVLKCTHDSGGVVICRSKSDLDFEEVRSRINNSLKRNYYYNGREWPYKNVTPRIICEKYMVDESGYELKDYKLMSFNGKVKCSFVCHNRDSDNMYVDFYDNEWNKMPFKRHYPSSPLGIVKPHSYDEMIRIAEKISKGIPFLRVDFYDINGKIYFGELTFFPGSGFEEFTPDVYDELLGSWIELPERKV